MLKHPPAYRTVESGGARDKYSTETHKQDHGGGGSCGVRATLSAQAQGEPSDLVPSLPLAATSPALCGPLQVSQMTSVPGGGVNTGGGGTSGVQEPWMFAASAGLAAAAGGVLFLRRRTADEK